MGRLSKLMQSIKNRIGYIDALTLGDTQKKLEITKEQRTAAHVDKWIARDRLPEKTLDFSNDESFKGKVNRSRFYRANERYEKLNTRVDKLEEQLSFDQFIKCLVESENERQKCDR